MRKHRFIFTVVIAVASLFPFVSSAQGLKVEVSADDYSGLRLNMCVGDVRAGEASVCGTVFGTLEIEGCTGGDAVGQPALPVAHWLIEVPLCDAFEVVVSNAEFDTVDVRDLGMRGLLAPVQPDRRKSDTTPLRLVIDETIYSTDAYFSLPLAAVEEVGVARDRRLARLTMSPLSYNPVSGKVTICRKAQVDVRYTNADIQGTKHLFHRHHTPAFNIATETLNSLYPKSVSSSTPVRYTIVANSIFRGALDQFIAWKQRKGFIVDAVYTDDPQVGGTSTSIAAWLKAQYDNDGELPAPTYVLLVGDVAQVPPFIGQTDTEHVTDLYFATWSDGDNIPDCYYGRFSASSLSQLQPQIDKTLMYEQYSFSDPTFLDRVILVAGVDGGNAGDFGYTHADPTMDYAATNYFNQSRRFSDVRYFKNEVSIVPNAQGVTIGSSAGNNADAVRATYNLGASLINYSAHGSPTCWGTPYFSVDHVGQMTNSERFGLMIGNCCLSNKFDDAVCLGEALLRRGNYCGAVGYIGGSNSTYWGSDFYWAVGVRSSISASMSLNYNSSHLGVYDRVCHTHNENHSKWAESQGSIIMSGNMAVQSGNGGNTARYYWEIYHLMGDPSLMPYLTQAYDMNLTADQVVMAGSGTLHVDAVPYAYVALTNSTGIVTAAFADANGGADLTFEGGLAEGEYELAVSAQQYRQAFMPVRAIAPEGACLVVNNMVLNGSLEAGTSCQGTMKLCNLGDVSASCVNLYLSSDNSHVSFAHDTLPVGTVTALSDVTLGGLMVTVAPDAVDGEEVTINITDGGQIVTQYKYIIKAANIKVNYEMTSNAVSRGGTAQVTVRLTNVGHATMTAADLQLVPQTELLAVTPMNGGSVAIPYGQSVSRIFQLNVSNRLPNGAVVALLPQLTRPSSHAVLNDTLSVLVGSRKVETFNGNIFHTTGWQQGAHQWQMCVDSSNMSNICLRSSTTLTDNQTSSIVLSCQLTRDDSIAFRYRVSSENNYDWFRFYIDGVEQMSASGLHDWVRVGYAVPAGQHTFEFRYQKDYSVSDNWDCAMIDDVMMPFAARDITYRTDHLCMGDPYAPLGDSIATQNATSGTVVSADSLTVIDYVVHGGNTVRDTVVVCDSYTVGSSTYTQSADMVLSLTDQYGCDSTVALHLTVGHSSSDTVVVSNQGQYTWNGETYTEDGTYVRYLFTAEGCDSVLVLMLGEHNAGIGSQEDGIKMLLYPNPTASVVMFDAVADRVEVYDVSGRMLAVDEMCDRVDLSSLPQGVYLLKLTVGERAATCRVQKK